MGIMAERVRENIKLRQERLELISECRQLIVSGIPAVKNEQELKTLCKEFMKYIEKIEKSFNDSGIDLKNNAGAQLTIVGLKGLYANQVVKWMRDHDEEFKNLGDALLNGINKKTLSPLPAMEIVKELETRLKHYNIKLTLNGVQLLPNCN
ncbi:MAG: hypothetical protein Q7S22_07300 [Candidatus Micrarchaeota archaeon]|nr:hypothetical protein [Candidatus Micrarchaeota archaeon]